MLVTADERTPRLRLGFDDAHRRTRRGARPPADPKPRCGSATTRPIRRDDARRAHARTSGSPTRARRRRAGSPAVPAEAAGCGILALDPGASVEGAGRSAAFAREEAAGIPRDAAERTYRDENHKPELIVAVSDTFRALAGLRDLDATRRLARGLGAGGGAARRAPGGAGCRSLGATRSGGCCRTTAARRSSGDHRRRGRGRRVGRVRARSSTSSASSPRTSRATRGIVVALLMNLVDAAPRRGAVRPGRRAARLPGGPRRRDHGGERQRAARRAHPQARRRGANCWRCSIPRRVRCRSLRPEAAATAWRGSRPDVADFALAHVVVHRRRDRVDVDLDGVAIALATAGEVTVAGGLGGAVELSPGAAVLVDAGRGQRCASTGDGEVFIAAAGRRDPPTVITARDTPSARREGSRGT